MGKGRGSAVPQAQSGSASPMTTELSERQPRAAPLPTVDLGDFLVSAGLGRPSLPKWARGGASLFLVASRKVTAALRARRDSSVLEMLVFRKTLRLMQMSDEGSYGSDDDDEMSVAGDGSESDGDVEGDEKRKAKEVFSSSYSGSMDVLPDDCLKPAHLKHMIAILRKGELPSGDEAKRIVYAAFKHLEALPNLIRCEVPDSGRFVVVGDIHGQLKDLNYILEAHGGPSPSTPFLFNGDFVDRGKEGVEVLLCLFCHLLLDPSAVFLNRGNHEDNTANIRYGFRAEVAAKYPQDAKELYGLIQEAFLQLPLMYVIGGGICVTHGGLPSDENVTLAEIDEIDRRKPPRVGLPLAQQMKLPRLERIYQALLWSDPKDFPATSAMRSQPSVRGAGCFFGKALVDQFLKDNHLQTLIRSHEVSSSGYDKHHAGKTITVFSASNYGGTDDNQACHLVIQPSLQIGYEQHSILSGGGSELLKGATRKSLDSGADQAWLVGAKQECLKLLRQAIFAKRQELLHEFEGADKLKTGRVTLDDWVKACQVCIHAELPWYSLSRHLVVRETKGGHVLISYVSFLERFQNGLARSWMTQWVNRLKPFIAERLATLADERGGYLSYFDMCQAMQESLPGIKERSVYYILAILCPGGRAKASVFRAAAESAEPAPPGLLDLWVMFAFRKDVWRKFIQDWARFTSAETELKLGHALPPITAGDFATLGMRHCGGPRQRWLTTAESLTKAGCDGVDFVALVTATEVFGGEWKRASHVLDILATLARANVGLEQLFTCLDVDGDGSVSLAEFKEAVQQLVGHKMTPKEVAVIFQTLDTGSNGSLSLEELKHELSVTDTWDVLDPSLQKHIERKAKSWDAILSMS